MKVAGVIAEYNPFHKGHEYHIEKTKKVTGADYVVVVMSGDYVQRGTPSFMNKFIRTRLALLGGADIVLELPVQFSTASAESFARGGISILNSLGCVDYVSFGCETDHPEIFDKVSDLLSQEPHGYKVVLQSYLSSGLSFPAAREAAVKAVLSDQDEQILSEILSNPNNTLGIEYMKALKQLGSRIQTVMIERQGDSFSSEITGEGFASATGIREAIVQALEKMKAEGSLGNDMISGDGALANSMIDSELSGLSPYISQEEIAILKEHFNSDYPIIANDFSGVMKFKLMVELAAESDLTQYLDVSTELANRIRNNISSFNSYDGFVEKLKTKQYTYTRISRALMHILLGIKKPLETAPYARILGFRNSASELVKRISEESEIPVITKPSKAKEVLFGEALASFNTDVMAAEIYESIVSEKFSFREYSEYKQNMVIL